uniref:Membrane-associated kinase regulator 4 n=2 Tax=Chenopodium quinoa TaxID=63459 RepID=A0A803MVQ5_CHEQI
MSSPQHPREFEFQMSSSMNVERESTTSPADELFYMGKLLPLHLPPRLQMVEKLLQDSTPKNFKEFYSTPLGTNAATTPLTSTTPFESCNISPVESCQVSRELNPEEYFSVYANGEDFHKGFIGDNNVKKSWTRKLKTKIKSLFGKSDELSVSSSVAKNKEEGSISKSKEDHLEKQMKGSKKISCKQIDQVVSQDRFERQNDAKEGKICHRRSFSGAFKRRSSTATKLSSSSSPGSSSTSSSSSSSSSSGISTSNSNGLKDFPLLKRSSSAKSEIETSLIQGAIAHCKQSSQQALQSRKTLSEAGCHSFPSSRFAVLDDQTSICRG